MRATGTRDCLRRAGALKEAIGRVKESAYRGRYMCCGEEGDRAILKTLPVGPPQSIGKLGMAEVLALRR